MVPQHSVSPQTSAITDKYSFSVANNVITAGDSTTITISGKDGNVFKGYFVQVRPTDHSFSLQGSFTGNTRCSSKTGFLKINNECWCLLELPLQGRWDRWVPQNRPWVSLSVYLKSLVAQWWAGKY